MTKRILSEDQKEQARVRAKNWYHANKERAKKASAQWRQTNPERAREKSSDYYQKNKESIVEKKKIYNAANIEKFKAYHVEYEKANKEKRKAWRIANRELKRLLENNRRLKIVGLLSKGIVQTLMDAQRNLCNGCGLDLLQNKYHMDHIVPVSKGGQNIDSNVQLLCVKCNTSKGAKDFDEWKKGMAK